MYTSDQLFAILKKRISDNRPHKDYDRTVTVANWCYQMMTGNDQKEILVTYKVRETDKQMQQRIRITNSRTQYVSNKVMKMFNEVHRCDDVTESITYEKEQNKLDALNAALSKWTEGKHLQNYLDGRFRDLVFYDPNAYVVVEFVNDDPVNKLPTVYPFEVAAKEVYDHKYVNGVLNYIISQHETKFTEKANPTKKVVGMRYTMYAAGYSIVMQHIPKEAEIGEIPEGFSETTFKVRRKDNDQYFDERFLFNIYETKSPRCPAIRAGYMDDPETGFRTKVSPMYPSKEIMTDLIWNKSEYDLSKALHGFYQKFAYVSKCETCHGEGLVDEVKCTSCKGTGKQSHTTVQDIVEITLPDSFDSTIPPLANFVHYATIPEHLINKQKEDYQTDQRDVFNAIFGSNVLDRTEIAETATAKHYDWRAVNNTLSEYADHRSEAFKFFVKQTASVLMADDGLTVQHSYPSDFKLESVEELIDQRSSAVGASVPMAIISHIDLSILAKQHRDDPEFIKKYKARERFRPMRDKSKDERAVLMSMLPPNDPERVLYIYFERIMDDVFDENENFADMDFKKQKDIVRTYVDQRMPGAPSFPTIE